MISKKQDNVFENPSVLGSKLRILREREREAKETWERPKPELIETLERPEKAPEREKERERCM